jgi:hypothetical protein
VGVEAGDGAPHGVADEDERGELLRAGPLKVLPPDLQQKLVQRVHGGHGVVVVRFAFRIVWVRVGIALAVAVVH